MSMLSNWALVSRLLEPLQGQSSQDINTATLWQQLVTNLEPCWPTDANETRQAAQALEALLSLDHDVASTSKDSRSTSDVLRKSVSEWYSTRCEAKFDSICAQLIAPLKRDLPEKLSSSDFDTVIATLQALADWLDAWTLPFRDPQLLASAHHEMQLANTLRVQLRSHINDQVVLALRASLVFTFSLEREADVRGLAILSERTGLSATILTLLTDVLHSQVSNKARASIDPNCLSEDDEMWELEEPARDRLFDWLNSEIKPRFRSMIEACSPKDAAMSDAVDGLVEDEFADSGTWESRLDYQLDRTLCEVRAKQLFDLIAVYPDSVPALQDLRLSLDRTGERLVVSRSLSDSLQTRLLHPGAHTRDIIQIYVHMVRALREVDPSGVVLSRVVSPLRRYLRARKDTIPVIVSSLLGEDPNFTLLKDELEGAEHEDRDGSERPAKRRRGRRSLPTAGAKRKQGMDTDSDSDDPDWNDPEWQPKPVDAGPGYRQSTSRDMIGMLISIFDDRAGFIQALERSMADQLVRVKGYRATREYRNNLILKKRFGERHMGKCDVMLGDVTESRRIDTNVHARPAPPGVVDVLHPLILSRQFWPEMPSGEGGLSTLPPRLAAATETYEQAFKSAKAMRRLAWLHHLGTVDLELNMADGRTVAVECSLLQAAVVELASQHPVISVERIMEDLGVEKRENAAEALAFWSRQGVLRQLAEMPGSYEVVEHMPPAAEDE